MMEHDVHERAAGVFEPDTMLPTQYFGRLRRRSDLTGERRLMFAVVEDAVDVYRKHAAAGNPLHRRLFAEAEAWIESDDRTWLYAFETICDHLGLDADCLRQGLRRWKRRARGEAEPATEIAVVPPAERRRASNE
jgi:hypothetical protein